MQLQPQSIARLVVPGPPVGLLLPMIVAIIVLTGTAERPLRTVPVLGAVTQTRTEARMPHRSSVGNHPIGPWVASSRRPLPIAIRDHGRPQHPFFAELATTSAEVFVDRSRDRRTDLMDMAISIRWHRGAASDLPPGSD